MEMYRSIFEYAPDAVILVDKTGLIARVNTQAEKMFGYTREELIGRPIEILIPKRYAADHARYRSSYLAAPRLRPMGAGLDLFAKRKDDSEFPVDLMLSPLNTDEGDVALAVVRDITDRRESEQRIIESLREKEVLLKEIHHRVKNNLAVVSSLFYLQSTYTQDEQMLRTLQESQDRVRSMALVHETLYQSDSFAELDFSEYSRRLSDNLVHSYSGIADVRLKTEVGKVAIDIDLAVPCGLILNELVSNALKHAFPNGRSGKITVKVDQNDVGVVVLQVVDDGIGIPVETRPDATRTLGLRLIESLTRQLDGNFELNRKDPGTEARLTFTIRNDH